MSSPRKEASEKFNDVKETSDRVTVDARDQASNPGAERGAGGGHVSEGGRRHARERAVFGVGCSGHPDPAHPHLLRLHSIGRMCSHLAIPDLSGTRIAPPLKTAEGRAVLCSGHHVWSLQGGKIRGFTY